MTQQQRLAHRFPEKRAGSKEGEILTGALFKITAISSGVDFSGVTPTRNNATLTPATIKSNKLFLDKDATTEITSETKDYTTYYGISTDKKTLLFYSDGTTILNILADGTYELEELAAPEGYIKGDGIITITVKDGEITVNADNTSLYGYEESSYTLTVVNTAKSNDIFISKKAVGGTDELEGALITITPTEICVIVILLL